jgi:hypothetical protein
VQWNRMRHEVLNMPRPGNSPVQYVRWYRRKIVLAFLTKFWYIIRAWSPDAQVAHLLSCTLTGLNLRLSCQGSGAEQDIYSLAQAGYLVGLSVIAPQTNMVRARNSVTIVGLKPCGATSHLEVPPTQRHSREGTRPGRMELQSYFQRFTSSLKSWLQYSVLKIREI